MKTSKPRKQTPAVAAPVTVQSSLVLRVAANLRSLRKAKRMSQADLAEATGAHVTHVNRVETGKYAPSLDFVVKAARAFDVSVDTLLAEPDQALSDVRIENKNLAERVRLIEALDEYERTALMTVIDSMLTKHRMRALLGEATARIPASL